LFWDCWWLLEVKKNVKLRLLLFLRITMVETGFGEFVNEKLFDVNEH
jgi:hypothetical protein